MKLSPALFTNDLLKTSHSKILCHKKEPHEILIWIINDSKRGSLLEIFVNRLECYNYKISFKIIQIF